MITLIITELFQTFDGDAHEEKLFIRPFELLLLLQLIDYIDALDNRPDAACKQGACKDGEEQMRDDRKHEMAHVL